jgi:WD40-like Beta Propeller Repeat
MKLQANKRRGLLAALTASVPACATAMILLGCVVPAWATPPGENGRIAYASYRNGLGSPVTILLTDLGPLNLPPADTQLYPAWSPDGTQLAFIRLNQTLNRYVVEIVRKDGSDEREVVGSEVFGPPGYVFSYPAWTADGRSISFVSDHFVRHERSIYTVRVDGTGLTRIVDISYSPDQPEWSSRGDLAFVCDVPFNLVTRRGICVSSGGGGVRPMLITVPGAAFTGVANVQSISWSPDGQTIVFAADGFVTHEGDHLISRSELFRINKDGTSLVQLTKAPDACPGQSASVNGGLTSAAMTYRYVAISPDGKNIVAVASRNAVRGVENTLCDYIAQDAGLWTVNANGGAPALLLPSLQFQRPSWQPIPQSLRFNISDGHGNPLKGMKVELRRDSDTSLIDDHPINTVGGTYVFEDGVAPGTFYILQATLVDHCIDPCTPSFDVRYAPGVDEAVWFIWRFKVEAGQPLSYTLTFDQNDPLADAYNIPGDGMPRLDDMADIYFQMRQYVDWVKGHLTPDTGATVRLYTFATVDPVSGASVASTDAYYERHGGYIVLGVSESEFENRDGVLDAAHGDDGPQNDEWHEFTHHLYHTQIDGACLAGKNHGGYNNPDSCDSMHEGFATFLPAFAARDISGRFNGSAYATLTDLEWPSKAWVYTKGGLAREDFAVAGLFWDLTVRNGNSEPSGVIAWDGLPRGITYTNTAPLMPIGTLWNLLTSTHPATVFDFRRSLGDPNLTIDLDGDGLFDVAPIDLPFLMHGFHPIDTAQTMTFSHTLNYYDVRYAQRTNGAAPRDGAVGLTSHYIYNAEGFEQARLIPRSKTGRDPRANVALTVLDLSGRVVSGATVTLTATYPGGQTTSRQSLGSGAGALVHLELPPYFDYLLPADGALPSCDPARDLRVTVTLRVEKDGETSAESPAFDNCTYLHAIAAATGPAALTFTVHVPVTGPADINPPITIASLSPQPNAAGWNHGNVSIALSAADEFGGSGVKETTFSASGAQTIPITVVPGAAATVTVGVEGDTTLAYFATDNASNREAPASVTVHIDSTVPVVTYGAVTPAPNAAGWNNTDVSIGFTADDSRSGVAAVSTASPLVFSGEGSALGAIVTATDRADNSASYASPLVRIDRTPPTVSFAGNAGRYTIDQTIRVTCTAADPPNGNGTAASGLASSTCAAVTAPAYSFAPGVNTLSASATDNAGNAGIGTATFTVYATPDALCLLTKQFVEGSAKFSRLPPGLRVGVDRLIGALCEQLASMSASLTAAQKARLLAAYQTSVANLASAGWLTSSQAAIVINWSRSL